MSDQSTNGDEQQPITLVPIEQREVDFYGDKITATLVNTGNEQEVYVPLRPICNYLGLDWSAQTRRLQRDMVLREAQGVVIMATPGGLQEMTCLPLDLLPGWLFGVDAARVKPELRDKIKRYQRECFRILWRAFEADALNMANTVQNATTAPTAPVSTTTPTNLTQIRDLGRAITQLAEQQIIFEQEQAASRQQQLIFEQRQEVFEQALVSNEQAIEEIEQLALQVNNRLDQAAQVVREIGQRLSIVEYRTSPTALISEEQASQVALAVKALAEQLSRANPTGSNQYQAVYTELYRRFGLSSYKRIRRNQFESVLTFLDSWRSAGSPPATPQR